MTREEILARLDEIREEAEALDEELRTLSDAEELDETQEARFGELMGDDDSPSPFVELKREKEKLNKRLSILDARDELQEPGSDRAPQLMKQAEARVDVRTAGQSEIRDAALKTLETEHKSQVVPVSDEAASKVEKLIRTKNFNVDGDQIARRLLLTENDHYRSAWAKTLFSPQPAWTPEEARALNEFRAEEQSLTNASGGYGVPVLIDPTIILTSGAESAPLLGAARVESITTKEWKGVSSAGVAFTGTAEHTAATADHAELAQPTVTPEKTMAYIPYSYEIEGDFPNFAGEMSALIEQAYVDFLAVETATGSAGVVGIFTAIDAASGSEVVVGTSGELHPADALVPFKALPERYRSRAAWFMDVSVESELRVGADGYGTRDLSSEGIGPLLGKRVLLSDYAPDFEGTTGTVNLAILGDFQRYVVAQRVGMNIELIPNVVDGDGIPTGARAWLAWARVGADSVDDNAFRLLKNAT